MIKIYVSPSCTSCRKVKKWFKDQNIIFSEKNILSGSLTKEDIQITVSAKESGLQSEMSGLADSAYSLDKTNWSNSNVLTVTTNGTYTIYVRDNAGNIAQQDITISNIDKTGPTIQLTANTTEWTNENVKLTVSATDNEGGAGLDSSPYSWDAQQTWGTTTTRYVSSNGEYTV